MSSNNMTAITDVVFDFGGVLLDWQPRRALEDAAGIDDSVLDDFFSEDDRCGFNYFEDLRDRGATKEETLPEYQEEYGNQLAHVYQTFEERWAAGLVGIMPGMSDMMDDLARKDIRLWGLTNWAADRFETVKRRYPELLARLDDVVVSGQENMAKPDQDIYELAARRFGLNNSATVFIDDLPCNVDAACTMGWTGIRFHDATQTSTALHALIASSEQARIVNDDSQESDNT